MSNNIKLARVVKFYPAYNKMAEGRGRHGVNLLMALKGDDKGAVSFSLYTNWYLPDDTISLIKSTVSADTEMKIETFFTPQPAGIDYHSLIMLSEYDAKIDRCDLLDGQPCYSDGSVTASTHVYNLLLTEGDEAVWKYLEEYYRQLFIK